MLKINKNYLVFITNKIVRILPFILLNIFLTNSQRLYAQDLIVSDTTISTVAVFESENSIVAGPNFVVANNGNASLKSNKIYFRPFVSVHKGGKLTTAKPTLSNLPASKKVLLPKSLKVCQNYPNPFNPSTTIQYELFYSNKVTVNILNLLGQKVKTIYSGFQQPGIHSIVWNGTNEVGEFIASGIYYYQIKAGKDVIMKKMLLIK